MSRSEHRLSRCGYPNYLWLLLALALITGCQTLTSFPSLSNFASSDADLPPQSEVAGE